MKWSDTNSVVEALRQDTRLYLPTLSKRLGFSSSRTEHLLNQLVGLMPKSEVYLEVGVLHGRTLEAASIGNDDKLLYGCDPSIKYDVKPAPFGSNVHFFPGTYQAFLDEFAPTDLGLVFYDGDHSAHETALFIERIAPYLALEAVIVFDDWDRVSVRDGAFKATESNPKWCLLREMPEWTDGLTCAPHHFGYYFGVGVWGFRR